MNSKLNQNNIQPVTERFVLQKETKDEIMNKKAYFGFNGLGEVVFRRTYSRNNESWNDVVIRVVEGVLSIRKDHFKRNSLLWNDNDWQQIAKNMALSLFDMEWLPPGRGLWMMGTDFTYERGSTALNNCSATDTKEDLVHSAEWTMDCLMNGVGVGFTTYWRGTATKPDKEDTELYVIPDSREGWVESLILLMCSYINSPKYGKNKFPKFDYSQIRKQGLPIKGFGGLSSGPEPLTKMHQRIEGYLDAFCDEELNATATTYKEHKNEDGTSEWKPEEVTVCKPYGHTRLIADIFNAIGACVVAGNVRRSAEICLGEVEDSEFIDLKNYEKNPERGEIGWMSNNSVVLKADQNYEDFSFIPDMAKRIVDNGEPGMINLYNMQKFARYGKEKPDKGSLVNPCFSGDTLIATADGRGCVPIKQLAEEGKDVPVYSMNKESGEISIQWGRHPRITGENKKLLRIHFGDSHKGEFMDVTPNHKFFLNDGRIVEAKDLKENDSIPQFKKGLNGKNDYVVVWNKGSRVVEHRMIAEFNDHNKFYENYQEGTYNGCCKTHQVIVHHKDEDKSNNHPDNLEITTATEHNKIHNQEYMGEGNPMYGKKHSLSTKELIGSKCKKRCEEPEYRKMLSDSQTPEQRENASKTMKALRAKKLEEYYDNVMKENVGLHFVRDSPSELKVVKTCENECCSQCFLVPWAKREAAYCSHSCANTKKESIEKRKIGQAKSFEDNAKDIFHKQAMLYKNLLKNNPNIQKKDFEKACKEENISCRFNAKSPNKYIAKSWANFKQMVDDYNHRVSHIEELDGQHTVYNITVENNHTLAVITKQNSNDINMSGIFTSNCGEITLENFELCNLAEVFPPRCKNADRFYNALRFATFYASTVSLLPTHRPETNAIIAKNRRIGVSISGIAQWATNQSLVESEWGEMNYTKMTTYLREGYKVVRNENAKLAELAGVPASVRITTVKPSGSISLLAGCTPGVHYPVSRYAIRRMRIGKDSPLVNSLIQAGIPHEDDTYSDNTLVFSFAIDHGNVRPCEEVSPWEQFSVVAMLQRCYADNCVSATVYFDKVKDAPDVEKMLAMYIPILKSVSLLPHSGHGYAQAPYEPINKEVYDKLKNSYNLPNFEKVTTNVPEGSKYCDGDMCVM